MVHEQQSHRQSGSGVKACGLGILARADTQPHRVMNPRGLRLRSCPYSSFTPRTARDNHSFTPLPTPATALTLKRELHHAAWDQQSVTLLHAEYVSSHHCYPASYDVAYTYTGECVKTGKILASFVDPRQAFGPDKIIPPSILSNAKVRFDFVYPRVRTCYLPPRFHSGPFS